MGVFDQELILPGVITDIISDYSSGYDTSNFGTTDSVTILGTAFNGPVGKPIKIYSPEHANYVFGSTFDFKTRREATLVAEIQNAWERGCRTIYAIRITGKEIYKDFQLATDVNCKLRVSGLFPNNNNKDVFFEYNAIDTLSEVANGDEPTIKIYKPADRATIEEKMLGKVINENTTLVNTIKLKSSWNVGATTRLVDFIQLFNSYEYNNVITLSIVDLAGNDITETPLAQGLSFGDMFAGIYFIGRDKNSTKIIAKTDLSINYIPEDKRDSIYDGFNGNIYKTLKVNTDVTKDLPIYHTDVTQLNKLIGGIEEVTMVTLFDFLKIKGKVDYIWLKDKVDYEEVGLDNFEIYKRLGSGFATSASIKETKEGSGIYKVSEVTNENDANRIIAINDGMYSALENLTSDYRVLTGVYADSEIKGTLPKKSDFLVSNPKTSEIFSSIIAVTPKLAEKDLSKVSKKYKFVLKPLDESDDVFSSNKILEALYTKKNQCPVLQFAYKADTIEGLNIDSFTEKDLIIAEGKLYKVYNNSFVEVSDKNLYLNDFVDKLILTSEGLFKANTEGDSITFENFVDASALNNAKYINAFINNEIITFRIKLQDAVIDSIEPIGLFKEIIEESSVLFTAIVPTIKNSSVENIVYINAANLLATTLGELIISINNSSLGEKFVFNMGSTLSELDEYTIVLSTDGEPCVFDEIIDNVVNTEKNKLNDATGNNAISDREDPVYSKSLYIPYRTTDNFARQLAQHCIYTGLKTAPTHGIIGCTKLVTTDLKVISDRVNKIADLDLNLYAKKSNGNDMLDKNNMPYPIGRGISVTFFQNQIETSDNYTYTSTGASAYAGMVSALPIDQSSTSQPINLTKTAFELTNYQLARLTQAGYVTVKNSYTQGYVITDGVTMAPATSPFRRLSVTRIINGIDDAIRTAAEPYIGKQNHLANRNSLETSIKSSLDKMLNQLIEKYDFRLVVDKASERMGIIEIEYNIVPIYEIREVRNRISIKDNQ